ncbi:triadin isoform X4 [Kryptolebias marmoratus]|uniref:triadin isoform X4 n=1 Tax=Kryptolebias marmoratus TaxID=37003 RepID=UPI000D52F88D|nr:triadin isoform X4 [Kryptolebias marmoratus]
MTGQRSGVEASPPSRSGQRTFVDEVILTFTSPMAWLLVVALIITWSAVAIVLFDLLDYKTLTAGVRSVKPSPAGIPGDVTAQESSDWLEMIWMFIASLVAPDEEEEGIHHLTETLTSFHSEEL